MEIHAIVEAVKEGDVEQFAGVVKLYHVQIRAYVFSQVHDRDEADDIAQQTFLFALERLNDFNGTGSFFAWLMGIARVKVMDYLKRSSQRRLKLRDYLSLEIARKSAALMEVEIPADDRLEALRDCVSGLPDNQRQFLNVAYQRESTLQAVALELGRSETAVRKHLSRLYDSLRHCVENKLSVGESLL